MLIAMWFLACDSHSSRNRVRETFRKLFLSFLYSMPMSLSPSPSAERNMKELREEVNKLAAAEVRCDLCPVHNRRLALYLISGKWRG